MEINMIQRRHSFLLPRTRAAALPTTLPETRSFELPRLGRFVRTVTRFGSTLLDWLNRLGARPIDTEALEQARARQAATLRIKGIGH